MAVYYPKTGVCYEHREGKKIYMIYTFKCNAACAHCIVKSGPKRKEKLSLDEAVGIVTNGAVHGKDFLTLSGGEAMVYRDEVLRVAAEARDCGYYVCLNTNGFWARTMASALSVLEEATAAGVQAVFPSVSIYHARYVPVERVRNVRDACRQLGVVYEPNFFDSTDTAADASLKKFMGLDEDLYFFDGLTVAGNDAEEIARLKEVYRQRTPDELDDCLSVHMSVNPHGQVVMTCNATYQNRRYLNTPFYLGNFHERPFQDLLEEEARSSFLQFLYDHPHPALHHLLRDDPVIGDYYQGSYSQRTYYNVVEYYLAVCKDGQLWPRIEALLDGLMTSSARE